MRHQQEIVDSVVTEGKQRGVDVRAVFRSLRGQEPVVRRITYRKYKCKEKIQVSLTREEW